MTADHGDTSNEADEQQQAYLTEAMNKPLHNKWVLWYDNPKLADADLTWEENLKKCGGVFDTPASFWRVHNNVKPPSQLTLQSNYHMFKEGVAPMWEDPENQAGGKWVITLPKKDPRSRRVDELWLFTVLAVVGETMDDRGDTVCGAVVSIRKQQDRIALWLKTDDEAVVMQIGTRWKKALDATNKLKYQVHRDGASIAIICNSVFGSY